MATFDMTITMRRPERDHYIEVSRKQVEEALADAMRVTAFSLLGVEHALVFSEGTWDGNTGDIPPQAIFSVRGESHLFVVLDIIAAVLRDTLDMPVHCEAYSAAAVKTPVAEVVEPT